MRIDDKCLRIFVELRAFPLGSVDDHRNVHFYPLATAVFRQSVCTGEFLVVHKTTFLHFDPDGPLIQTYSPRRKVETGFRVCLRAGGTPLYSPIQSRV